MSHEFHKIIELNMNNNFWNETFLLAIFNFMIFLVKWLFSSKFNIDSIVLYSSS